MNVHSVFLGILLSPAYLLPGLEGLSHLPSLQGPTFLSQVQHNVWQAASTHRTLLTQMDDLRGPSGVWTVNWGPEQSIISL